MLEPEDFLPISEFVRRYPHLGTEPSHRWAIFNATRNGLQEAGAIARRGRRLLIVIPRYISWLTSDPAKGTQWRRSP